MGWFFCRKKKTEGSTKKKKGFVSAIPSRRLTWKERWEQFELESRLRPDYTRFPGVEEEAKNKGYFSTKPATPEAIEKDRQFKEQILKPDSLFQFLLRCQERQRKRNEEAIAKNNRPYRKEDAKLWKSLPHVPGPNGLPMPRKSMKSQSEANDTFWDFFKQFHFGLWGYRQRPYPPEKPNDIQQMLGYKWLDKRYSDFVMRSGGWYYKDRLGRSRGPMELVNLKTAWAAGIVDRNTFIWGDDMDEWAPIHMVYGLEQCIDTPDMRMAAAGADLIHKITRGIPLSTPKKGHEKTTFKELQAEALENRERERAVLRLNGGVWPGERAPSHTLFLWAGGSELTKILEEHHKYMPDKYIPYRLRKKLAEVIPGLRPWEVMDVEQVMEKVTFGKNWYRSCLGSFTSRADYDEDWFGDFKEKWDGLYEEVQDAFANVDKAELLKLLREDEGKK